MDRGSFLSECYFRMAMSWRGEKYEKSAFQDVDATKRICDRYECNNKIISRTLICECYNGFELLGEDNLELDHNVMGISCKI